jgi:ATP-dependent RNA helicase RhlE
MNFASFGLSDPILKAVAEQGYKTPSPIQAEAIPAVLKRRNLMATAQTGTGKTGAFALPLLEGLLEKERAGSNQVRALILTPTRELANQVADSIRSYSKHLPLRTAVVFGGVKISPQIMKLRRGTDVLIATPGRLLDLHRQNAVNFKHVEVLVLDEADRMLDMGFIDDIRTILAQLPKNRQNLMFSATFSDPIRKLAKTFISNPVEISVNPHNSTASTVTQLVCPVDKARKADLLSHMIRSNDWEQVLVFTRTKHGADNLTKHLKAKRIKAAAIHGNKSQGVRRRTLEDFKNRQVKILVATDIAARGIDIDQLPHVVNFDLPHVAEDYVHRIGRTGRAGAKGQAISLVSADEFKQLLSIERLIKQQLKREITEGFEPTNNLPSGNAKDRPKGGNNKPKWKKFRGKGSNTGEQNNKRKPPRQNKKSNRRPVREN